MTDFWHDQCVLVTGTGGFLGQHIWEALAEKVEKDEYDSPAFWGLNDKAWGERLDLRFQDESHLAFETEELPKSTLVIHCAANVGGIGKNKAEPGSIMYDNLLMNTHVLHEAYMAGVQKFVGIGSVCAYPKHTPAPFREHNLLNGYPEETNAPYGLAKRALLVMGQAYRQQYGFNAIHLLLANMYGPGDSFDLETGHVIPAIMRKMHEAKANGAPTVTLWGDGSASREFLFVEDAAQAILLAAERYDDAEPVNIGTGQEVYIRELAHMIAEVAGYTGRITWDTSKPNGQPRRVLDTRKINAMGWYARTRLQDGLQRTYDWYVGEVVGV